MDVVVLSSDLAKRLFSRVRVEDKKIESEFLGFMLID